MEDIKSEELLHSPWPDYRNSLPMPSRFLTTYDLAPSSPLGSPCHGISGNSSHPLPNRQECSTGGKEQPATAPRPSLKSHYSHPSLKRSCQAYEEMQYSEVVPELCNAMPDTDCQPKPTIHPDHRLLSFGQTQARHTILDQYGRPGSMEIAAQIHGMFFLSEMATNSGASTFIQPELTCYRRNLFQISGSVAGPAGPISVLTDLGQTVPIIAQEVSIFATESVDGHVIKLIVIPWKIPPPNSPEVPPNQEQEPPPIPLTDHVEDSSQRMSSEVTIYPIAWRRLQFRTATANNGRRKELQQHFVLRLSLTATLADSTKLRIAEAATAPIVVRGRSPRNFQARKEIPLVGLSASPRGHTSRSSLVEKKGVVISEKPRTQRRQSLDLAKRPFQFDASNFPPSPMLLRHGFNQWTTPQQQSEQDTAATTPTYPSPQMILQSYVPAGQPNPEATRMRSSPISQLQLPLTEATMGSQFYQMSSAPPASSLSVQFIDRNLRPIKSPRHAVTPDLSNMPLYPSFEERVPSSYAIQPQPSGQALPPRDHFPVALASDTWTTAENGNVIYTTSMPPPPPSHHYIFAPEPYVKDESPQTNYAWSAA